MTEARRPKQASIDAAIVERLATWFEAARRDLPWRDTKDPYAIWLSEVMLQQTRVKTVLSYYPRFLDRFPTVRALAEADREQVLGAWSGLGYYRRARALHLAAREIVERHGGEIPSEAAELRAISGIGPYTAGAIASIAFGKREALVDGNVARVLARLFAIEADIRSPRGNREIWEVARRLVPEEMPGRHNEALMELGATVCLPREPRCRLCPLGDVCKASAEGRQDELPVVTKKKPPPIVEMAALLVKRGEGLLLGQRIEEGLFAGMWEPPMVELGEEEPASALGALLGWRLEDVRELGEVRHVLTHRELHVTVLGASVRARRLPDRAGAYAGFAWVGEGEMEERGVSSLARKVMGEGRGLVDSRP